MYCLGLCRSLLQGCEMERKKKEKNWQDFITMQREWVNLTDADFFLIYNEVYQACLCNLFLLVRHSV